MVCSVITKIDPNVTVTPGTYAINPNYVPHGGSTSSEIQYRWTANSPMFSSEIKMPRSMQTGGVAVQVGGHGGFVTVGARSDFYGSASYLCHR